MLTGEDRLLDLCSAWVVNDEREGARGSLRFISPGRGPNGERCHVAGGSNLYNIRLEPDYGDRAPLVVEEGNYCSTWRLNRDGRDRLRSLSLFVGT